MRVVTFVSVKGAPGVTTLACLVAATWPDHRRVAVVEADPFGGDLAARFRLSTALGMVQLPHRFAPARKGRFPSHPICKRSRAAWTCWSVRMDGGRSALTRSIRSCAARVPLSTYSGISWSTEGDSLSTVGGLAPVRSTAATILRPALGSIAPISWSS